MGLGQSTHTYHVLVTGKGKCGKTSVIASIAGVEYRSVGSNKGVDRTSMVHENDRFTWIDFGANITSASIATHIKNVDAIVFVVDASERRSISASAKTFQTLLALDTLSRVPVLIFANKQDKFDVVSTQKIMKIFEMHKIKDREWTVLPCTASTGKGTQRGFEWLYKKLKPAEGD